MLKIIMLDGRVGFFVSIAVGEISTSPTTFINKVIMTIIINNFQETILLPTTTTRLQLKTIFDVYCSLLRYLHVEVENVLHVGGQLRQ